MLKGAGEIKFNLTNTYKKIRDGIYIIGKDQETIKITNTTTIQAGLILDKYEEFWNSIEVKILNSKGTVLSKTLAELTTNASTSTITLNNIDADPFATILLFSTTKETAKFMKTELGQYDLKVLDQIRDVILHKKGNETLIITSSEKSCGRPGYAGSFSG